MNSRLVFTDSFYHLFYVSHVSQGHIVLEGKLITGTQTGQ